MDRAYSIIDIRSLDDEKRLIRGIATSPTPDRLGDVVEPSGVKVAADIPLFLYHDSTKTIGRARLGKASKDGIPFEATLPKVAEEGKLRERVEEAWQMLRYGLLTAVSIGFRPLADKIERMKDGGLRYLESEVLELSIVPVPAQPEAVITAIRSADASAQAQLITSIKSLDEQQRAAFGTACLDPNHPNHHPPPGVSGTSKQAASRGFSFSRKEPQMKTISEQITDLEASRQAKTARMQAIMQKAMDEGRSTDQAEGEEYDGLEAEVTRADDDLKRLRNLERLNAATAKPVNGNSEHAASQSRAVGGGGPMILPSGRDAPEKFKGQAFTRLVIARALARQYDCAPVDIAVQRWGRSNPTLVEWIGKAAVPGGGTGSGEWGSELVAIDGRYRGDFIEFLNAMTVYDRLGLRQIPANVMIKGQDGAATAYWVGESKAIPATTLDFFNVELRPLEVGALTAVSNQLLRDSSPAAEQLIRDALVNAAAQRIDTTFLSAAAAVAGVAPAGILNGVTPIVSSGTDADALRADIRALYASFITARNATGLTLVTTPSLGKSIQLMVNALGQPEFAGAGAAGGTLLGDALVTGDNVPAGNLILLKPTDIYRIGDDGVDVALSRDAMIEQDTAPSGATDTPSAATASLTSMFQSNSTAIRVIRSINFAKRRASAVAVVTGAAYA